MTADRCNQVIAATIRRLVADLTPGYKVAYGWAVGERANTGLALAAWSMAKQTFQEYGISSQGMVMHHDQDSVYTGFAWTH